jgi:hypothetical protein
MRVVAAEKTAASRARAIHMEAGEIQPGLA